MFYNDFFGCVLRWAFCKYRSLLSELCKDPLEVPGEEGHFSGSPGGSELPRQELQGAVEGQVGVGMALLGLGRRIRVEVLESMDGRMVSLKYIWTKKMVTKKVQDTSWNSPGQNIGVNSLSLLQGIVPTQGLNPGLLHCRQILYQLSRKGSPW